MVENAAAFRGVRIGLGLGPQTWRAGGRWWSATALAAAPAGLTGRAVGAGRRREWRGEVSRGRAAPAP
ncbi:hypothetical protein GCM10027168_43400 [Streptomyces capparidis]